MLQLYTARIVSTLGASSLTPENAVGSVVREPPGGCSAHGRVASPSRHELIECGDPTEGDAAHDADVRDVQKRASIRAQGKRNAKILTNVLRNNPGIGERQLLGALQAAGHGWGSKKFEAAKQTRALSFR